MRSHNLPKWISSFLSWLLAKQRFDGIYGDLLEEYNWRRRSRNALIANICLIRDAIILIRHQNLHQKKLPKPRNIIAMKSYFLFTFRRVLKHKFNFFSSVINLAVGLAVVLLIALYVNSEMRYDKFHSMSSKLYRLNKLSKTPDGSWVKNAESSGAIGPALKESFPEVDEYVRFMNVGEFILGVEDNFLREREVYFTDAIFLTVFDFNIIRGSRTEALKENLSIVITESLAQELFEDKDPIGEIVEVGTSGIPFKVTAIAEDPPANSHITFRALVSWASITPGSGTINWPWANNWSTQTLTTYLVLNNPAGAEKIKNAMPGLLAENLPHKAEDYQFYLQHFPEIYLHSADIQFQENLGSFQLLRLLVILAGIVLLIAIVNYVNQATAHSLQRTREIGIRKALGAHKRQLITQFLTDSLIITFLAGILALVAADLFLPTFNNLSGKSLQIATLVTPISASLFLASILFTAFIAGIYPAWVISSYKAVAALKGKIGNGKDKSRQVLLTFQYASAIGLLITSLVVLNQIRFLNTQDLGFNSESVITVSRIPTAIAGRTDAFKRELLANSAVADVSLGNSVAYQGSYTTMYSIKGVTDALEVRCFPSDLNFMNTYQIAVAEGRGFRSEADSTAVLVNQKFLDLVGKETWEGLVIAADSDGKELDAIGLIDDFYYQHLNSSVEPSIIFLSDRIEFLSLRFESGRTEEALQHLAATWKNFEDRMPLEYTFVDEILGQRYATEQRIGKLINLFTAVIMALTLSGIIGLTAFMVNTRFFEMSLRKILGADKWSIMVLTSRDFLKLTALAFVLVAPGIYYFLSRWLEGYAFRISISLWWFLLSWLVVAVLTLLSVSTQGLRLIRATPIAALKNRDT